MYRFKKYSGALERVVCHGFEWTSIWSSLQVIGLLYVSKDIFSVSEGTQTGLTVRKFVLLCNKEFRDSAGSREGGASVGSASLCVLAAFLCCEQEGDSSSRHGNVQGTKEGLSLLMCPFGTKKHFSPKSSNSFPSLELTRIR